MKIWLGLYLGVPVFLGTGLWGLSTAVGEEFALVAGRRQLFLDDYAVDKVVNLTRTMHSPVKKGAVIRGPQTRSATFWVPDQNRYLHWSLGNVYASRDGRHWSSIAPSKPRMDCVVYDATESDRARRFKGMTGVSGGVGFFTSSDGVQFTKLDVPAIPSSDEYNFSFDEQNHLFIATVKQGGPYGRCVWLSTSRDFSQWTKPELVFHADELDQKLGRKNIEKWFADPKRQHPAYNNPKDYNVDVYNMGIFRYEGIYIGLPAMFHHTGKVSKDWKGFDKMDLPPETRALVKQWGDYTGFHHVQLACSRDLKHWQRLGDRKPFIDLSLLGGGDYDTQTIMPPSAPMVRGEELWFYYTGARHYENIHAHDAPGAVAICLAILRRDGFIALTAGENEGYVTTKPFVLPPGELHLNVDARKGRAVVQLCEATGKAIAGFENSQPVTGNHPDIAVTWPKGDWSSWKDKKVSLRVKLRNAQLFSFWIQ